MADGVLLDLPDELLEQVASYLVDDPQSIGRAAMTCRRLYWVFTGERVWKQVHNRTTECALRITARAGSSSGAHVPDLGLDNTFRMKAVRKLCFTSINKCSLCLQACTNRGIDAWHLRLCHDCLSTQVLTKTASIKEFALNAAAIAAHTHLLVPNTTRTGTFYLRHQMRQVALAHWGSEERLQQGLAQKRARHERRQYRRNAELSRRLSLLRHTLAHRGIALDDYIDNTSTATSQQAPAQHASSQPAHARAASAPPGPSLAGDTTPVLFRTAVSACKAFLYDTRANRMPMPASQASWSPGDADTAATTLALPLHVPSMAPVPPSAAPTALNASANTRASSLAVSAAAEPTLTTSTTASGLSTPLHRTDAQARSPHHLRVLATQRRSRSDSGSSMRRDSEEALVDLRMSASPAVSSTPPDAIAAPTSPSTDPASPTTGPSSFSSPSSAPPLTSASTSPSSSSKQQLQSCGDTATLAGTSPGSLASSSSSSASSSPSVSQVPPPSQEAPIADPRRFTPATATASAATAAFAGMPQPLALAPAHAMFQQHQQYPQQEVMAVLDREEQNELNALADTMVRAVTAMHRLAAVRAMWPGDHLPEWWLQGSGLVHMATALYPDLAAFLEARDVQPGHAFCPQRIHQDAAAVLHSVATREHARTHTLEGTYALLRDITSKVPGQANEIMLSSNLTATASNPTPPTPTMAVCQVLFPLSWTAFALPAVVVQRKQQLQSFCARYGCTALPTDAEIAFHKRWGRAHLHIAHRFCEFLDGDKALTADDARAWAAYEGTHERRRIQALLHACSEQGVQLTTDLELDHAGVAKMYISRFLSHRIHTLTSCPFVNPAPLQQQQEQQQQQQQHQAEGDNEAPDASTSTTTTTTTTPAGTTADDAATTESGVCVTAGCGCQEESLATMVQALVKWKEAVTRLQEADPTGAHAFGSLRCIASKHMHQQFLAAAFADLPQHDFADLSTIASFKFKGYFNLNLSVKPWAATPTTAAASTAAPPAHRVPSVRLMAKRIARTEAEFADRLKHVTTLLSSHHLQLPVRWLNLDPSSASSSAVSLQARVISSFLHDPETGATPADVDAAVKAWVQRNEERSARQRMVRRALANAGLKTTPASCKPLADAYVRKGTHECLQALEEEAAKQARSRARRQQYKQRREEVEQRLQNDPSWQGLGSRQKRFCLQGSAAYATYCDGNEHVSLQGVVSDVMHHAGVVKRAHKGVVRYSAQLNTAHN
ncbi:hypothetical protein PTSG_01325 [Salpingoeca rosetta]|uniref:F-box domain-containing protein n=1 Tax=Salpingoeca rosetta (strain ATCC 50818 / BSB-021) TaxID=946362 RepID=F2U007_SALR5|nr:uncharacterized protein PTSG_01325 [Salpingoeca rosetta]EGD80735.1 hypothetical protein PTSG_01325 [Salpingoeca rosetta]|eukprot:XP_004997296.1 hypothetical protein PTSG_01325 [Salpingoeca rosetta]